MCVCVREKENARVSTYLQHFLCEYLLLTALQCRVTCTVLMEGFWGKKTPTGTVGNMFWNYLQAIVFLEKYRTSRREKLLLLKLKLQASQSKLLQKVLETVREREVRGRGRAAMEGESFVLSTRQLLSSCI